MSESSPAKKSGGGTARRSFLIRFWAVVCSVFVALFPVAAGVAVIFDPHRRRRSSAANDEANGAETGGAKRVRVCALDELTPGGDPKAFPVIMPVVDDAWTRTFNQKVGMVFLELSKTGGKSGVVALNAKCPHLGCIVDFDPKSGDFQCPCHKSAFAKDGKFLYGPSLRGMDQLKADVQTIDGKDQVFVAFQKFMPGIAERKPAG